MLSLLEYNISALLVNASVQAVTETGEGIPWLAGHRRTHRPHCVSMLLPAASVQYRLVDAAWVLHTQVFLRSNLKRGARYWWPRLANKL